MPTRRKDRHKIIEQYLATRGLFNLKGRYFEIFEYRNGITDGARHTAKETGEKFGISATRAGQIEARVIYEIEKMSKTQ